MKQYISGFITAVCLSFSFLMFTASQTQNLGDITVNSIRVVDNDNGGFISIYDEEGRITSFIGVSMAEAERSPRMTRTMFSIPFRMLQIKIGRGMRS